MGGWAGGARHAPQRALTPSSACLIRDPERGFLATLHETHASAASEISQVHMRMDFLIA